MAFRPKFDLDGKVEEVEVADAQAVTKGCGLTPNGSGYLALAAAGDGAVPTYVALETKTTTAAGQTVLAVRTKDGVFEADCDAAPARAVIHEYIDLASSVLLDADAQTDQIFYVEKVIGAVGTSTTVQGWFAHGTPQS